MMLKGAKKTMRSSLSVCLTVGTRVYVSVSRSLHAIFFSRTYALDVQSLQYIFCRGQLLRQTFSSFPCLASCTFSWFLPVAYCLLVVVLSFTALHSPTVHKHLDTYIQTHLIHANIVELSGSDMAKPEPGQNQERQYQPT